MKTQIDIKSAVFGLVLGVGAMFALGAGFSNNEAGRFDIAASQHFFVIVDTKTGEAWGRPATTDEQPSERTRAFWSAK